MDINQINIGEIVTFIVVTGTIVGFGYKLYSFFNQVKENTKEINKTNKRMDALEINNKTEKDDLLLKVEETNSAVNLLCSAISALIDNAITGGNIEQLKSIKIKLDEKKEIV